MATRSNQISSVYPLNILIVTSSVLQVTIPLFDLIQFSLIILRVQAYCFVIALNLFSNTTYISMKLPITLESIIALSVCPLTQTIRNSYCPLPTTHISLYRGVLGSLQPSRGSLSTLEPPSFLTVHRTLVLRIGKLYTFLQSKRQVFHTQGSSAIPSQLYSELYTYPQSISHKVSFYIIGD